MRLISFAGCIEGEGIKIKITGFLNHCNNLSCRMSYTLHSALAEEMEIECNNIINQALGGTFASRAIPKYYPPHPYDPEKVM
jgi:hypothetical protein